MKCNNCGNENPEYSAFCSYCGNALSGSEQAETPKSVFSKNLLNFFKDKLFLALCILVSVSTAFSVFGGNIPLLSILFTIFLWIIYAKAYKNTVEASYLRCVSGTIFANYVINWVIIGILGVISFIGVLVALIIGNTAKLQELIERALSKIDNLFIDISSIINITSAIIVIVVVVLLLVICAVAAIINIFGLGSIHKFAKSLYKSAESDIIVLEKISAAKNWILVFGIFQCISALSNILSIRSLISSGCMGAAYILAYLLINKYFISSSQENL